MAFVPGISRSSDAHVSSKLHRISLRAAFVNLARTLWKQRAQSVRGRNLGAQTRQRRAAL